MGSIVRSHTVHAIIGASINRPVAEVTFRNVAASVHRRTGLIRYKTVDWNS